jgi:general secretion pathway protein M
VTILIGGLIWSGVITPLQNWYSQRAATLMQQTALVQRMEGLAALLPALRRQLAADRAGHAATNLTLAGETDAIASATLQERVQSIAKACGASLSSIETLPAEQAGTWRKIGLHVSLTVPWPSLIRLMQALDEATPRILVDDLRMHAIITATHPSSPPLQASFAVHAFRAGNGRSS